MITEASQGSGKPELYGNYVTRPIQVRQVRLVSIVFRFIQEGLCETGWKYCSHMVGLECDKLIQVWSRTGYIDLSGDFLCVSKSSDRCHSSDMLLYGHNPFTHLPARHTYDVCTMIVVMFGYCLECYTWNKRWWNMQDWPYQVHPCCWAAGTTYDTCLLRDVFWLEADTSTYKDRTDNFCVYDSYLDAYYCIVLYS